METELWGRRNKTPDLLSVEEEPARLDMNGLELSCCRPSLVESPEFELELCTTGRTERKEQKGDVSEIQGGSRKGLCNKLKPEYFSLSVESVSSDQEETEEVSMEPESHIKAQDLHGDWTKPISPINLTIDSGDEYDVMELSAMTVRFEAVNEETNEQTEPTDLHGEHAEPIVPGLAIGITRETDVSVLKPLSEGRNQAGPCSPLEVFESVSAFLNAKMGKLSFNNDSRRVMSGKMTPLTLQDATTGNERVEMESDSDSDIENNQHRLKIPMTARRRKLGSTEFDLESESQAKDNQCMDSETQIPYKTSLTDSSVETDDSSDRPKIGQRRRHSTRTKKHVAQKRRHPISTDTTDTESDTDIFERKCTRRYNSTKKHVAQKRRHPIPNDTSDTESDTEDFEHKYKRLATAPTVTLSSESVQCNDKAPLDPLIFSDVTEDSSDDCTLSESRWGRPKTSPTERLASETEDKSSKSITSVTENSSDDSAVSQHGPVVKRLECSSVSPSPCAEVQSLPLQSSLMHTGPLQLKRKTLGQTLQKHANAESTKLRAQNPPSDKERPSIDEEGQVNKLSPSKFYFEKTEMEKKQKSDEQKLFSPESRPKSPLRENYSKREEKRSKEKSYRPYSPMQNREKTEEMRDEYESKNVPNKDQTDKKILNPERNSTFSKPDLPKIPKFHKDENRRFAVPTVHTPRTSSCHIYPVEEEERKGEKRDAQKSSCPESLRTKEKTDVKRGDQHSSGPKVSGSSRQTDPSIAMAAPSPTNGPVKTTGSAREQVHSNWKSRFIPTPVRRGRRSGSIEDHTSPLMKSMVQSGSRKDHAAPLMKKSMVEAERWTKANHHEIQRDSRHSSSHGTHKTNEQPHTFEERYKWAEEQNIRQNRKSYTREWNRSRKNEGQNPLDQLFRK